MAPSPYADATGGFARWADATLAPDDAEAAVVLRRACSIGMSRGMDLDQYPTLADMPGLSPVCWSMQPERAPVAFRNRGLIRDYDERPDAMLAEGPAVSTETRRATCHEAADHLGAERLERGGRREVGEPHVEALDTPLAHRGEVVEHLLAPTHDEALVPEAPAGGLLDRGAVDALGHEREHLLHGDAGVAGDGCASRRAGRAGGSGTFHQSACAATSSIVRFAGAPDHDRDLRERRRASDAPPSSWKNSPS